MSQDYYLILEITRDSNIEKITNSFKRLSAKYNPMANLTNQGSNNLKFNAICEAYEVLSNSQYKAQFDKFGEYGLKQGQTNADGQKIRGYMFLGNSEQIFNHFINKPEVPTDVYDLDGNDAYGSLLGDGHGAKNQRAKPFPSNVEVVLTCTLFEFYNGSNKTLKYTTDEIHVDGRTITKVNHELKIQVKPGTDEDTVMKFAGLGNQQYGHKQSDLTVKFKLDQSSTPRFQRRGNNLFYKYEITFLNALKSAPVQFFTLDNRSISLNLDQVITPQTVHEIQGEGMPLPVASNDTEQNNLKNVRALPKGNLYVTFDVTFPPMDISQRQAIVKILKKNKEEAEAEEYID